MSREQNVDLDSSPDLPSNELAVGPGKTCSSHPQFLLGKKGIIVSYLIGLLRQQILCIMPSYYYLYKWASVSMGNLFPMDMETEDREGP